MKTRISYLIVVVALVGACGGGAGSEEAGGGEAGAEPSTGGTQTTVPPEPSTPADTTPDDESDEVGADETEDSSDSPGSHLAVVTIGDRTFEFTTVGHSAEMCNPIVFGGFQVGLFIPDENGVSLAEGADPASGGLGIVLPGDDWEDEGVDDVARVVVNLWGEDGEGDEEWIASKSEYERIPELADGNRSQVDSYTVEGNTASGTATFYERNSYFAVTGGSADEITVEQGTFEVTCVEG